MVENPIAFAVPIFVIAIAIESIVGRRRGAYRVGTSLSDLGVGIVSVVSDSFLRIVGVGVYAWVYDGYRMVSFEAGSPWPWVIGMLGVDFIYYWWHRTSHVVNVLWAVHVVHHQSEDFNYAVALRQPALEATAVLLFYLPLALLGVSPYVYVMSYALNLFYQFWVHTELVDRLGPLEWVLNTPSHHRVHHGVNPKYLDRNYAGILIVWDRLFGSFQAETDPVVFGVTTPLRSYNPLFANVEYWVTMWRRAKEATGLGTKLRVIFAHPGWHPGGSMDRPPEVSKASFQKYDPRVPGSHRLYVGFLSALTLALVGGFFTLEGSAPLLERVPIGVLILLSVATVTGLAESRPWAAKLDAIRQIALVVVAAAYLLPRLPVGTAATGVAITAIVSVALSWGFGTHARTHLAG